MKKIRMSILILAVLIVGVSMARAVTPAPEQCAVEKILNSSQVEQCLKTLDQLEQWKEFWSINKPDKQYLYLNPSEDANVLYKISFTQIGNLSSNDLVLVKWVTAHPAEVLAG